MDNLGKTVVQSVISAQVRLPKSTLPSLSELATPPLLANGLVVAYLLLDKHLLTAMGIVSGCAVGLIIYSALHYFAENVFRLLTINQGAGSTPAPGNLLIFGMLAGGKFVVVAVLMYVSIAVLHFSIGAFVAGFVVTQACVSLSVINRLTKTKITD